MQLSRVPPGQSAKVTAVIQKLSAADLYLDATSYLPVALDFNVHPDNNAGLNLPVEIRFSNYELVNGVRAPFHIQEYLQGSLLLDIVVESVTVNSGLSDSLFALPATEGVNQ